MPYLHSDHPNHPCQPTQCGQNLTPADKCPIASSLYKEALILPPSLPPPKFNFFQIKIFESFPYTRMFICYLNVFALIFPNQLYPGKCPFCKVQPHMGERVLCIITVLIYNLCLQVQNGNMQNTLWQFDSVTSFHHKILLA